MKGFSKHLVPVQTAQAIRSKKKKLSLGAARATRSKEMSFVAKPACVTLPRLQTKPHGATHGQFLFQTPAPLLSIRQEIMHCSNR